jgi:hypothetical protein
MTPRLAPLGLLTLSLLVDLPATTRQVPQGIDRAEVLEAIRIAADDKEATRLLTAYVLQPRARWGEGPPLGLLSTPFSRVVHAAMAARRTKAVFGADDVPPALLTPEVHVIATSQPAWPDGSLLATVQSVVLIALGESGTKIVEPVRTVELTPQDRELYGITSTHPGVVALFPSTALAAGTSIRVTFDRFARGLTSTSMCRECVAVINLRRIR